MSTELAGKHRQYACAEYLAGAERLVLPQERVPQLRAMTEAKAYGAGLLSSYGEIETFRDAEIRGWDLLAMATQEYDIMHYQLVLFAASSFE